MYVIVKILNPRLTCQVEDAIAGADVRQEGVPQALARVGAFHQSGDVHHIEECWDFAANQEGSLTEILFKKNKQTKNLKTLLLKSSLKTVYSLFTFQNKNQRKLDNPIIQRAHQI